jgi:glucokinase
VNNVMIGALDIGGTKIAAGAVDEGGRVLSRLDCPTAPKRGFEDACRRMSEMLQAVARAAGEELAGIGIGCTGPVDPVSGKICQVDFLPGWEGAEIVARMNAEFGVPVAMENDADAAALGEARWGAGRGKVRFLLVTIGTGIGGGAVLDGRLYRGVNGAHPEVGHHVIDPAGPLCFCGARGCWESLASGPAMVTWMQANTTGDPLRELTAREICAMAASGGELARRAVEREARYLGMGVANLTTLFCPDAIALGGGVMQSGHLFLTTIRQVMKESCGLVPFEETELTLAQLGDDTGLAGAACAWLHRFGEEKARQ